MPFWQNPHCGVCSSIQACCTGWSVFFASSAERPFCLAHLAGKTFERGDLLVRHARDRRDAGTRFLAVDQDGAGSALCESATELRADQLEIVAQNVEQRSIVRRLHLVPDTIHIQSDHKELPSTDRGIQMTLTRLSENRDIEF